MKNDIILEIFDFLRQRGIVASEGEFCMDWLGQCDSYIRGLRFRKTEPSMGAVAICGSRLLNAAEQMQVSPRHHQLSEQLRHLSEKCRAMVDAEAVEFELAG